MSQPKDLSGGQPKGALAARIWPCLALLVIIGAVPRLVYLNRFPPALHFDEAVYGLMAQEIGPDHLPLYFSAYTGREPLYMYLMALLYRIFGVSGATVRLASAAVGIATIPLAYLLFAQLFDKRTGLLTAVITTFSYWHLALSRSAYPNILIPPLECLALYYLWRGYDEDRLVYMALGGAFVGGVLYTYLAARLFPLTVTLFFLYAAIVDGARWRKRLLGLIFAAATAVLVFAPLGIYFTQHVSYFWERADQVLVFRATSGWDSLRLIVRNFWQTLLGFVVRGDPRWKFNLPGRPVFTPLLAPFFLLGIIKSIWRIKDVRYGLLLVWLVGMCVPAILTETQMPQSQRTSGVVPVVFAIAAVGLVTVVDWANVKWSGRGHRVAVILVLALLLFDGAWALYDYFGVWGQAPENLHQFHKAYELAAERASQEMAQGNTVVIISKHYQHPSSVFAASETEEALWSIGSRNLLLPVERDGEVIYLWAVADVSLEDELAKRFAQFTETESTYVLAGEELLEVYHLREEVRLRERQFPAIAQFGQELAALDWQMPDDAERDEPLHLIVHWRALAPVEGDRYLSVHLYDGQGLLWAQRTTLGFMPDQWQPGDTVYQQFEIELPEGIPAGTYEARLLYGDEQRQPQAVLQEGQLIGTSLPLGEIELLSDGRHYRPLDEAVTSYGQELAALEHSDDEALVLLGGPLERQVLWQAQRDLDRDYAAVIRLKDEKGNVIHETRTGLAGAYPTSEWRRGEVVRARYRLDSADLPTDAEEALYTIELQVAGLDDTLDLGSARVVGEAPRYEVPKMGKTLSAVLGENVELLGYDLPDEGLQPGDDLELTLYWRASAPPQVSYKVFVHLVDAGGQMATQDDSVPVSWTRPTSGWRAGEVIVDRHVIPIPPDCAAGQYQLYVGMYHPETLARLSVSGKVSEDDRVSLGTITVAP